MSQRDDDPANSPTLASPPLANRSDVSVGVTEAPTSPLAYSSPVDRAPPFALPEGGSLGERYVLLGEIGRGAEGVVLRARDTKADTVVALKLLGQDVSPERLGRFRRELALARKVTHPNVVRIYDLVEVHDCIGLSMELIQGETLGERIARGPALGPAELLRLAHDLAMGLAAAHEASVIHRDLKPSNVLLRASDGRAVITDFGVSRSHAMEDLHSTQGDGAVPAAITLAGALVGTPLYMAPEQLRGEKATSTADVYAFGAVMFEAATGRPLHKAASLFELREAHRAGAPLSLNDVRPDLPHSFAQIVNRCIARDPLARFPSGVELRDALGDLRSADREPPRRRWRFARATTLSGGAALIAAGALAIAAARRSPPRALGSVAPPAAEMPHTSPPLAFLPGDSRRITFDTGCEEFPSFTSDGRRLVFDATLGQDNRIFVLDLATHGQRPITHVHGLDFAPDVSPDGQQVTFLRFEGERYASYAIDIEGRTEPQHVADGRIRPAWSHDGKGIWAGEQTLTLFDARDAHPIRTAALPNDLRPNQVRELSDGSLVVLSVDARAEAKRGVGILPPHGTFRWLLEDSMDEVLAMSHDEKHALVTVHHDNGVSAELYDVPLDGSPPVSLLSSKVAPTKGLRISPDGGTVAWSNCHAVVGLAVVDRAGAFASLHPDVAWHDLAAAWIPGTEHFVLISSRGGSNQLWAIDRGGNEAPRLLSTGTLTPSAVAVAPDGRTAVVRIQGKGLYAVAVSGDAALRVLTSDPNDTSPTVTRDGKRALFTRQLADGARQIWSVPLEGGEPRPLLARGTSGPSASPVDGRVVGYVAGAREHERVPTLFDPGRGTERPLSKHLAAGHYGSIHFSPDGRRVAIQRGSNVVAEVDVASEEIVREIDAGGDQLTQVFYDASTLMVIRTQFLGDLMMAELSRR